jgi:hypothetical protein
LSTRLIAYWLAIAFVAAGFGLGLLFATLSAEDVHSARAGAARDEGLLLEGAEDAALRPPPRSADSNADSRTTRGAEARTAEAAGAEPPSSASEGAAPSIVEGVVQRIDGTPLEGVLVRATPYSWQGDDDVPKEKDEAVARGAAPKEDDEAGMDYFSQQREHRKHRREARTDVAGRYRIEVQSADHIQVEAYLEGFQLRPVDSEHRGYVERSGILDFLALPLSALEIDVRAHEGAQPSYALIHAHMDSDQRRFEWTPASPRIWISEGAWKLAASLPRQEPSGDTNAWTDAEVGPDAASGGPIVLQLEGRGRLEGRIAWPQEELLGPSVLEVRRAREEDGNSRTWVSYGGNGSNVVRSDGALRYRLDDLPWGTVKIEVAVASHVLLERSIDLRGEVTTCDFDVPAIEGLACATCRVLDPGGKPALDASVVVSDPSSAEDESRVLAVRRRAEQWTLACLPRARGDVPRELVVRAMSPRFGNLVQQYDPRTTETLELRFHDSAQLALVAAEKQMVNAMLAPAGGAPGPDMNVYSRFGMMEGQRQVEAPGRAVWKRLQPGAYRLSVSSLSGEFGGGEALVEREVQIVAGRNELSVELPVTYAIRVLAPEFTAWPAHFMLQGKSPSGEDIQRFESGEGETTTIRGLAAGNYGITLWADGDMRQASFVLPGASEVLLKKPIRPATQSLGFSVQEIEPGSRASRSGLRVGDVIVGVDGKRFQDDASRWSMWMAVAQFQSAAKIAVTVERGSEKLELELERELIGESGKDGLKVLPHPL